MIFYILWNYLMGYVVIKVEGVSLEKFINLTVSKGIHLWRINRENYTSLTACISIRGFKQLHKISHKIKCRIRIVEKRGFPFIAFQYRHRKMLIAGMVIFLIMLYGFSSFVWSVDVIGTEKVDPQKLIDQLESLGVRPGVFKPHINALAVENRLIINMPEISWASLEIRGSKAVLRVAESVKAPTIFDKSKPSNIIAKKDGIVQKMIVLDGEAVVKVGDTVKKGQLLISGIFDHPNTTGIRYVHAIGQVMARTWYEGRAELSLKEPFRRRTGKTAEIKYVGWKNVKVPYKKEDITFGDYDLEVRKEGLTITEIYHEVEVIQWSKNMTDAKQMLEQMASGDAKKDIPSGAKIVDKRIDFEVFEGEKITAVLYIEALEDIAEQQPIERQ